MLDPVSNVDIACARRLAEAAVVPPEGAWVTLRTDAKSAFIVASERDSGAQKALWPFQSAVVSSTAYWEEIGVDTKAAIACDFWA